MQSVQATTNMIQIQLKNTIITKSGEQLQQKTSRWLVFGSTPLIQNVKRLDFHVIGMLAQTDIWLRLILPTSRARKKRVDAHITSEPWEERRQHARVRAIDLLL
jgi:hypothetical protein